MSDYTPTTEQVRVDYVMAYTDRESSQLLAERAFDRWLAAHDAAVAAKALRAAVADVLEDGDPANIGVAAWLQMRADHIEREGGSDA